MNIVQLGCNIAELLKLPEYKHIYQDITVIHDIKFSSAHSFYMTFMNGDCSLCIAYFTISAGRPILKSHEVVCAVGKGGEIVVESAILLATGYRANKQLHILFTIGEYKHLYIRSYAVMQRGVLDDATSEEGGEPVLLTAVQSYMSTHMKLRRQEVTNLKITQVGVGMFLFSSIERNKYLTVTPILIDPEYTVYKTSQQIKLRCNCLYGADWWVIPEKNHTIDDYDITKLSDHTGVVTYACNGHVRIQVLAYDFRGGPSEISRILVPEHKLTLYDREYDPDCKYRCLNITATTPKNFMVTYLESIQGNAEECAVNVGDDWALSLQSHIRYHSPSLNLSGLEVMRLSYNSFTSLTSYGIKKQNGDVTDGYILITRKRDDSMTLFLDQTEIGEVHLFHDDSDENGGVLHATVLSEYSYNECTLLFVIYNTIIDGKPMGRLHVIGCAIDHKE